MPDVVLLRKTPSQGLNQQKTQTSTTGIANNTGGFVFQQKKTTQTRKHTESAVLLDEISHGLWCEIQMMRTCVDSCSLFFFSLIHSVVIETTTVVWGLSIMAAKSPISQRGSPQLSRLQFLELPDEMIEQVFASCDIQTITLLRLV
jgi:hypothetical protein